MSKSFYLPPGDKERAPWVENFNIEFQAVAATLGFTPAEMAEMANMATAYAFVITTMNIFKSEFHEWTSYKDLLSDAPIGSHLGPFPSLPTMPPIPVAVPAGIFKSIAKVVQRIKNHPNYDESMGRNLGIIGAEKVVDFDKVKPVITVRKVAATGITLDFVKGGMDGVIISLGTIPPQKVAGSEDTGTTEAEGNIIWTELARVSRSPFVDDYMNIKTNVPETRYYKMQYFKKDVLVGAESDIMRVVAEVYKGKAGSELAKIVK